MLVLNINIPEQTCRRRAWKYIPGTPAYITGWQSMKRRIFFTAEMCHWISLRFKQYNINYIWNSQGNMLCYVTSVLWVIELCLLKVNTSSLWQYCSDRSASVHTAHKACVPCDASQHDSIVKIYFLNMSNIAASGNYQWPSGIECYRKEADEKNLMTSVFIIGKLTFYAW